MRRITKSIYRKLTAVALVMSMAVSMAPIQAEEMESVTVSNEPEVCDKLEVHGYQISAVVEGIRTVYSVEEEIDDLEVVERGLIYGVKGCTDQADMHYGSESKYVLVSPAVIGMTDKKFSSSDTAKSYIMTMQFAKLNAVEFEMVHYVRAYAKLSDGSYRYSVIEEYSIYNVASNIYVNGKMPDREGHNYVYDKIISVVDPDATKYDYAWTGPIVKPTNE